MIYSQDMIGKKLDIVDEFFLLNPHQIPFLNKFGFGEVATDTTVKWFEDKMIPYDGKLATGVTASDATLTVVDTEAFRPYQIIQTSKQELIRVVAVDVAAKTLTVERGHASTTATTIDANDTLEVLFTEGQEGRVAREGRKDKRVPVTNITQIFDDSIEVTGTADVISQYGLKGSPYEQTKQKRLLEKALELEKALINGVQYEEEDFRMMRGVRDFVKSNVTLAGGNALNLDHINDLAQNIYNIGGFKNGGRFTLWVPAKQQRALSKLDDNKIVLDRADGKRGNKTNTIVTDFGEFDIALNSNLRSDEVMLLDDNRIKVRPLKDRNWHHKYMGDQGDFTKGMIIGEFTLQFEQEAAHGRIEGLA